MTTLEGQTIEVYHQADPPGATVAIPESTPTTLCYGPSAFTTDSTMFFYHPRKQPLPNPENVDTTNLTFHYNTADSPVDKPDPEEDDIVKPPVLSFDREGNTNLDFHDGMGELLVDNLVHEGINPNLPFLELFNEPPVLNFDREGNTNLDFHDGMGELPVDNLDREGINPNLPFPELFNEPPVLSFDREGNTNLDFHDGMGELLVDNLVHEGINPNLPFLELSNEPPVNKFDLSQMYDVILNMLNAKSHQKRNFKAIFDSNPFLQDKFKKSSVFRQSIKILTGERPSKIKIGYFTELKSIITSGNAVTISNFVYSAFPIGFPNERVDLTPVVDFLVNDLQTTQNQRKCSAKHVLDWTPEAQRCIRDILLDIHLANNCSYLVPYKAVEKLLPLSQVQILIMTNCSCTLCKKWGIELQSNTEETILQWTRGVISLCKQMLWHHLQGIPLDNINEVTTLPSAEDDRKRFEKMSRRHCTCSRCERNKRSRQDEVGRNVQRRLGNRSGDDTYEDNAESEQEYDDEDEDDDNEYLYSITDFHIDDDWESTDEQSLLNDSESEYDQKDEEEEDRTDDDASDGGKVFRIDHTVETKRPATFVDFGILSDGSILYEEYV